MRLGDELVTDNSSTFQNKSFVDALFEARKEGVGMSGDRVTEVAKIVACGASKEETIEHLKYAAKKNYNEFWSLFESRKPDCGSHLAKQIIPGLSDCAEAFNAAMQALSSLDEKCPKKFKRL